MCMLINPLNKIKTFTQNSTFIKQVPRQVLTNLTTSNKKKVLIYGQNLISLMNSTKKLRGVRFVSTLTSTNLP